MTAHDGNGNGTRSLVWSLAALFATLLGALWAITGKDTGDLNGRVDSLEATRLIDSHEDGVADVTRANNVRDVEGLKDETRALDDRLQREMRDLNTAIIIESRSVDQRLQGEIGNVNDHLLALERKTEGDFIHIQTVFEDRAERITRLEERMLALERFAYPDRSDP